jgi:hypothetical protein
MTLNYRNDSSQKLGEFNTIGTRLVERAINDAIDQLRKDKQSGPIRLLDIGCGDSPYLRSFGDPPAGLSVTLIDRNEGVIKNHWMGTSQKSTRDFFDLVEDRSDFEDPYDIVVLAFVLHELRTQLALRALEPAVKLDEGDGYSDPAATVLKKLSQWRFVGSDTVIILADLFHLRFWDADELEQARHLQFEEFRHADPASAFLSGEKVLRHALNTGFELIDYDGAASANPDHKLCTHPEYGLIFRTRRAFCATLKRSSSPENTTAPIETQTSASNAYCPSSSLAELMRGGINANAEEQVKNNIYLQQLRKLVEGASDVEYSAYDKPLGNGLFRTLAAAVGRLARAWSTPTQFPYPESISFWFGINSLILKDARYALKEKDKWLSHKVYLDKHNDVRLDVTHERDWAALCFNSFGSPHAIQEMTGSYNWLKDIPAPSIYRWMTSLSEGNPAWKSVSIGCFVDEHIRSSLISPSFAENALVLQNYSPHPSRSEKIQGHTLIALPGDHSIAHLLGNELDARCNNSYCTDIDTYDGPYSKVRVEVLRALSSIYLDSLFLARGQVLSAPNEAGDMEVGDMFERFLEDWLDESKIIFFDHNTDPKSIEQWGGKKAVLPVQIKNRIQQFALQVRARHLLGQQLPTIWTCFIIRQPGYDENLPIATIMFMSDRPIDPALLELFRAQFAEVFFSIREVEAERKVRQHAAAEAKAEATQSMLGSLGHDGKRPAEIIRQVLTNESNLSPERRIHAAVSIAEGLISRLSGYTRLIDDGTAPNQKYLTAWREGLSASRFCSVSSIFEFELALTLLRVAVDISGKWPDLRRKLEADGFIDQLIDAYPNLDSILAVLAGKVSRHFEGPSLKTPEVLSSSEAETTNPRVFHALHFLFAEILTNAFRHEFPHPNLNLNQLKITLTVVSRKPSDISLNHPINSIPPGAVLADFCCAMRPSLPESHNDVITGSMHGLDSMANVANAIGASVDTRVVEFYNAATVEHFRITPKAFFLRKNGSITWNLSNVPCFLEG